MPRKPDPHVAQQWAQRLRRFRQAHTTVHQFCQREGVSTAAFYQWKRRLDAQPLPHDVSTSPQFVPIQLVDDVKDDGDVIEIRLPNGAVVHVPATLDTQKLCQLVRHVTASVPKESQSC